MFQSLRGIYKRFNCRHLECLIYLIFKVQLREATPIIDKRENKSPTKSRKSLWGLVRDVIKKQNASNLDRVMISAIFTRVTNFTA